MAVKFPDVHVSGVGVLGSFLLFALADYRIPFTWDDNEDPYNAWETTTGGVIPYADDDTSWYRQGYLLWQRRAWSSPWYGKHVRPVHMLYASTVQPPRTQPRPLIPIAAHRQLKIWPDTVSGYQVEVQDLVRDARNRWLTRRRSGAPEERLGLIRFFCRGLGDRWVNADTIWSWTSEYQLRPRPGFLYEREAEKGMLSLSFSDPRRPGDTFYFQPTKEPGIYRGGTDRRHQTAPHSVPDLAASCVERFEEAADLVWGEWFQIERVGPILEGWRPDPRGDDWKYGATVRLIAPDTYVPRPQAREGVQCGPLMAQHLLSAARLLDL